MALAMLPGAVEAPEYDLARPIGADDHVFVSQLQDGARRVLHGAVFGRPAREPLGEAELAPVHAGGE
eukprot:8074339-Alexandrium_andersonii.AAC.1